MMLCPLPSSGTFIAEACQRTPYSRSTVKSIVPNNHFGKYNNSFINRFVPRVGSACIVLEYDSIVFSESSEGWKKWKNSDIYWEDRMYSKPMVNN